MNNRSWFILIKVSVVSIYSVLTFHCMGQAATIESPVPIPSKLSAGPLPSMDALKIEYEKLPNVKNAILLADAYFYDALEQPEALQESELLKGKDILEGLLTKDHKSAEVLARLARIWGRIAVNRGGKEKIKLGKLVKDLADEAYALDPKNQMVNLVLGIWHYELADLSGVERFFGSVLFGEIPRGDMNASLKFLRDANLPGQETVFSQFALAQTLIALDQKNDAKQILQKGLNLVDIYPDDLRVKIQMKGMLKKLNSMD